MFCVPRKFITKLYFLLFMFISCVNILLVQIQEEHPKLQKEEYEEDFIQVMSNMAQSIYPAPILLTFTNAGQVDFVKSFLCNLEELGGHEMMSRLVVIVSDRKTYKLMSSFKKATLVLRQFSAGEDSLRFGTGKYMDLIEYRTQTILELLTADLSLLLVDADHFWAKSPFPYLADQAGFDIITENAHFLPWESVCGGFLFLNATFTTKQLWYKINQQTKFFRSFPETNQINEQDVMDRILPQIARGDKRRENNRRKELIWQTADKLYPGPKHISWKFFPAHMFAPGRWYLPEHSDIRLRPVWSVHNNWVVGNDVKIKRAKAFHHWFYNETSDSCLGSVLPSV